MDKEDVVHIYNGIPLSHKKKKNAICGNMDATREIIIVGEVSQKEKHQHSILTHIYGI